MENVNENVNEGVPSNAFPTMPEQLISLPSLLYIGFSQEKAEEIWSQWVHWPPGPPTRETDMDDGGLQMTFEDFFTGVFVGGLDTSKTDDREWFTVMEFFGLSVELQEAIMDPNFRTLRLTMSCADWARDTILMRYAGLRAGISDVNPPPYSPKGVTSASAIAARNAPGHTVLYKSIDGASVADLFHPDGSIKNIGRLVSRPPADFSGRRGLYYFTPHYEVAEYYAGYIKRRIGTLSVVIVTVNIPNSVIESLGPDEIRRLYWPSDEWKQLTRLCHRGQKVPRSLRKYQEATLVVGTASKKPNSRYEELSSWIDITEDFVLKFKNADGQTTQHGIQFVFGDNSEELLIQYAKIQMFRYRMSELNSWVARGGGHRFEE